MLRFLCAGWCAILVAACSASVREGPETTPEGGREACHAAMDRLAEKHGPDVRERRGEIDTLITPGRVSGPPPQYPQQARESGYESELRLAFVIDRDGSVRDVELASSRVTRSGRIPPRPARNDPDSLARQHTISQREAEQLFVAAAERMIRGSRFQPVMVDGRTVVTLVCVPIQFRMSPPRRR